MYLRKEPGGGHCREDFLQKNNKEYGYMNYIRIEENGSIKNRFIDGS